jgi:ABC-type transport system substrate-binding protein
MTGWLREVGIDVDVEALEFGMVSTGILTERDFDMLIFTMYTDVHGPMHFDYTSSCWSAEAGPNGRNYAGYCDEEFDNLVYEAYYATDEETFTEALYAAEEMINEVRPFIVLAGINHLSAYRTDRFEFPTGVCHEYEGGAMSFESIMNMTVK